jgi:predicted DNA-binding protein
MQEFPGGRSRNTRAPVKNIPIAGERTWPYVRSYKCYLSFLYDLWRDTMATKPISITIDEELAKKLEKIAEDTHRKKSFFVNRALEEYFQEIEDFELALKRRGGKSTPISRAKEDLGLS